MGQIASLPAPPAPLLRSPLSVDSIRTAAGSKGQAHEIARHFEALLIQEVVKAARSASGGGWLGEDADQASEAMAQMGEEFLANAMAAAGGIGLASAFARSIESNLSLSADRPSSLEKISENS